MPADPSSPQPGLPPERPPFAGLSRQFAMAMELPFVLVGTILTGGAFGYFLDRWLGTKPILTFVLGALGFAGGLREVLRRTASKNDGGSNNKKR